MGTRAPVRRVTEEPYRIHNPFIRRLPTTEPQPMVEPMTEPQPQRIPVTAPPVEVPA